jgi:peptidoglycan/xylan/chitin deacetylase (PgdA/CDA1 family)
MLSFKSVNIVSSLILIGLLIGYGFFNMPFWPVFLLFLMWLFLTGLGSSSIGWNYHFTSLNAQTNIQKNQIAITFDDGPHPKFTPKVLNLLKKYDAKATFFCIGKHIELYPHIFKTIVESGHTIGNHTYSHANNFGFFSIEKVISELQQTNAIIKQHVDLNALLFRPAFGVTNPRIKQALKVIKLQSIGWSKRSLDTTKLNEKVIFNRVTKNLKKGDVILLHDTSDKTIVVLEQLLLFLQQQHLESVSVDTLFNIKAYA